MLRVLFESSQCENSGSLILFLFSCLAASSLLFFDLGSLSAFLKRMKHRSSELNKQIMWNVAKHCSASALSRHFCKMRKLHHRLKLERIWDVVI